MGLQRLGLVDTNESDARASAGTNARAHPDASSDARARAGSNARARPDASSDALTRAGTSADARANTRANTRSDADANADPDAARPCAAERNRDDQRPRRQRRAVLLTESGDAAGGSDGRVAQHRQHHPSRRLE